MLESRYPALVDPRCSVFGPADVLMSESYHFELSIMSPLCLEYDETWEVRFRACLLSPFSRFERFRLAFHQLKLETATAIDSQGRLEDSILCRKKPLPSAFLNGQIRVLDV
jgi:hypothetical protein